MPSRRKWVYLKNKLKILKKDFPESNFLELEFKKGFMTLLSDCNINLDILKQYSFDYYIWLHNLYNPNSKIKKHKKQITYEDIPFYDERLKDTFSGIYECIICSEPFLKNTFKALDLSFEIKKVSYSDLLGSTFGDTFFEKTKKGLFYYKLPKEYSFFEFWIQNKDIQGNLELNISKTKLLKLPKELIFFGFIDLSKKAKKPYFLSYYKREEITNKVSFKFIERLNLLKNNLKERDFFGHSVDGYFTFDVDDIPQKDLKNDILLVPAKGNLFDCIILKGDK